MVSILAFFAVICVCVVIHEGGHYFAAVWRNVQVHEFAFGMGPRVVSKRRNGVLWAIRAFPIGGFVRLEGMEDAPLPEDTPDPSRAFPIRKAWERFVIIAGGPSANIALAWLLTAMLLMCWGTLDMKSPVIGALIPGYPAESMGAQPGDRVLSVNGSPIAEWPEIRETIQRAERDEITVVIERGGQELTLTGPVMLNETKSARLWGIQPARVRYMPLRAAAEAFSYCFGASVEILRGLWLMLTGRIEGDVAGPVGIAVMAGDAVRQGFWTFISFLAVINLNLGLLNLLPLPALDGGHLFFIFYEMIIGRKFPEKWENRIHIAGFAALIALIVFVTWKDIARLAG